MTEAGAPDEVASSYHASAAPVHSRQDEGGMEGPGPSWPGKLGAQTSRPLAATASIKGCNS
jgi:hypothetical protein